MSRMTSAPKALLGVGGDGFSMGDMQSALDELKSNENVFASPAWKRSKDNSLFSLEARPLTSSTSMPHIRAAQSAVQRSRKLISQRKSRRPGASPDRSEVPISTVKSKSGTWQYVGQLEGASETPNFRAAIAALERRFKAAMEVADKRRSATDAASEASSPRESGVSSFESDFIALRGQVDTHFTMREAISAAVSESKSGLGGSSQAGPPVASALQRQFSDKAINLPSLTMAFWDDTKEVLASCLYEQKWTDLVTAELATQLSVSCVEHGRILRGVRTRLATIYERMSMLHSDALWQLDAAVVALRESRAAAADHDNLRLLSEQKLHDSYAAKIASIHEGYKEGTEKAELGQKESNEQVARMGDTLRTLNGLFKDIQADTDAVKAGELRDTVNKLESDLITAKAEIAKLRPLKHQVALLQRVEMQLKKEEEKSAELRQELSEKTQLVNKLMAENQHLLTEREAKQSNDREGSVGTGEDDTVLSAPKSPGKENDEEEEEEVVVGGGTVMCVRCRKALDDLENIREAANESAAPQRMQCHAYRLLLPNLQGHRPPRSISWVRFCMRAILFGKIKGDKAIRDATVAAGASGVAGSNMRYRPMRFPEFVYSWFESVSTQAIDSGDGGPLTYDRNRGAELATADDNRWGLYYGIKLLARESIEAKFFWTMLDESHGEDYLTFYAHCIATVVELAGEKAIDQFGETLVGGISGEDALEHVGDPTDTDDDGNPIPKPGTQEMVFIDMEVMVEATERVLSNSAEITMLKYVDATRKIAVASQDRIVDPVSPRCVDVFLWLRIIMAMYRQDQVNRRAAVRLMFETAVSGVIAVHRPMYGDGRDPEPTQVPQKAPRVDYPQLLSILRTLDESIDCQEAAAVFRDSHESSDGKVRQFCSTLL